MTGAVEGDGGPLAAAAGAAAVSPPGDAGVEDGEGDAVGAAAEPEGEVERGLDDAAVTHGDDGLSRVAVDECGDRGARAGGEGHPALPAGREGVKASRTAGGRGQYRSRHWSRVRPSASPGRSSCSSSSGCSRRSSARATYCAVSRARGNVL